MFDPASVVAALAGALPLDRSLFARGRRAAPAAFPRAAPPASTERAALAALLWRRLVDAVDAAMPDEGCAIALSGGIDSAALTLAATDAWTRRGRGGAPPLRAYALADDLDEGAELARARATADAALLPLLAEPVTAASLATDFPDTVRAAAELIWNGRAVAMRRLYARMAREGDSLVLSGTGADEVLCGNPEGLRRAASTARRERAIARGLVAPGLREPLEALPQGPPPEAPLTAHWAHSLAFTLHASTLVPERAAAGAFGLGLALPYLDPRLGGWASSLPVEAHVEGTLGKVLLREALRGRVPDDLRLRPKHARLVPPRGRSADARAAWDALVCEWLSDERLRRLPAVDPLAVRNWLSDAATQDDPAHDAVRLRVVSLAVLAEVAS